MMRRYAFLLMIALCGQPACLSQAIRIDRVSVDDRQGGYFAHWDPVQEKLLLFRDINNSGVPAARLYSKDGASFSVYPLRDIQESWYIDVWDAAATPDGGLVLASVVGYTAPGVKPADARSALLIYDANGQLKSFWAVAPYHYQLVAVDKNGDIFGFGMNYGAEPYPLVVKYSPSGKVLKEFFSTSLLPEGEKDIVPGGANGQNRMFIANDRLMVWVATSKELFQFSLDGNVVSKTQLDGTLQRFAASAGSKTWTAEQIAPDENGNLIVQIVLRGQTPSPKSSVVLVRVSRDASVTTLSGVESSARLLWPLKEGKALFLQYDSTLKTTSVIER